MVELELVMRWPLVTRKRLERLHRVDMERIEEARRDGQRLTAQARREERAAADDILVGSLLPFVLKWTHSDVNMKGDRVQITLYVHAETIHELARDPSIAEYLGKTLGGQFAAELRSLRLVEISDAAKRLW